MCDDNAAATDDATAAAAGAAGCLEEEAVAASVASFCNKHTDMEHNDNDFIATLMGCRRSNDI